MRRCMVGAGAWKGCGGTYTRMLLRLTAAKRWPPLENLTSLQPLMANSLNCRKSFKHTLYLQQRVRDKRELWGQCFVSGTLQRNSLKTKQVTATQNIFNVQAQLVRKPQQHVKARGVYCYRQHLIQERFNHLAALVHEVPQPNAAVDGRCCDNRLPEAHVDASHRFAVKPSAKPFEIVSVFFERLKARQRQRDELAIVCVASECVLAHVDCHALDEPEQDVTTNMQCGKGT